MLIISINFENLEYAFIENEMDLHLFVKDRIIDSQKYYLIFDEIQNVINFEKTINSFRATLNCSIFISGSNGKLLPENLATHLFGRYVSFRIMSFSFKEFCQVKSIERNQVSKKVFFDDIPTHTRDFSRELVGFLFFPPKTLRWQTCSGIIKI